MTCSKVVRLREVFLDVVQFPLEIVDDVEFARHADPWSLRWRRTGNPTVGCRWLDWKASRSTGFLAWSKERSASSKLYTMLTPSIGFCATPLIVVGAGRPVASKNRRHDINDMVEL